ncbi:11790_t:CDS:2 [Acaulospora colombiana]|uniref:11790_t:CDS:1 n=1 Tax=Acaulospora colombiana TaxID=27376 RepID=A0ACA9PSL8_9GLOM|nr:11790_t:CDS:2 [Acaulospora colombiana]
MITRTATWPIDCVPAWSTELTIIAGILRHRDWLGTSGKKSAVVIAKMIIRAKSGFPPDWSEQGFERERTSDSRDYVDEGLVSLDDRKSPLENDDDEYKGFSRPWEVETGAHWLAINRWLNFLPSVCSYDIFKRLSRLTSLFFGVLSRLRSSSSSFTLSAINGSRCLRQLKHQNSASLFWTGTASFCNEAIIYLIIGSAVISY